MEFYLELKIVHLFCIYNLLIFHFCSRSSPSGAPQKISPRAVRQLKPTNLETDSASSSNQTNRTPKDKSPKVIERRSPRSPVFEVLWFTQLTNHAVVFSLKNFLEPLGFIFRICKTYPKRKFFRICKPFFFLLLWCVRAVYVLLASYNFSLEVVSLQHTLITLRSPVMRIILCKVLS